MHLKCCILIIAIIASARVNGQFSYGFAEGKITLKNGDTIHCFIERAIAYENEVYYKVKEDDVPRGLKVKSIKSLTLPFVYFENIQLGEKERLMSLLINGKVSLYKYIIIKEKVTFKTPETTGKAANFLNHFILEKGVTNLEIDEKTFADLSQKYFGDCLVLIDKIRNGTYKFEDIEKIVSEYNACSQ